MVPGAGFEPARISPHAPQACVSTNSTTPAARNGDFTMTISKVNPK